MKIMASGSISAIVKYSQVKNNLTTTAAGGVLDARQGKILSDKIASHGPTTQWQASGNINCTNNTITALQSVTLTAGTWIIFGFANWAANNTGYRQIQWNTNSSKDPSRYLATCGPAA